MAFPFHWPYGDCHVFRCNKRLCWSILCFSKWYLCHLCFKPRTHVAVMTVSKYTPFTNFKLQIATYRYWNNNNQTTRIPHHVLHCYFCLKGRWYGLWKTNKVSNFVQLIAYMCILFLISDVFHDLVPPNIKEQAWYFDNFPCCPLNLNWECQGRRIDNWKT